MSRFVVDVSVAVKWYVPEIHADAALRVLQDGNELLVPELLFAEFGNVLWKKARRGDIGDVVARETMGALEKVPLHVYAIRGAVREVAYEIARGMDRSYYDSVYLALAVTKGCRMVTADKKLYNAVAATPLGSSIVWIETLSASL